MKTKNKFYTVWIGRSPGIYSSWDECKLQISGFENAEYKSFSTYDAAVEAFNSDSKKYIGLKNYKVSFNDLEEDEKPIKDTICVDGSCSGKTGIMEYQGVSFPDLQKVFKAGPFTSGTNNIAEFLAIVHALTICKNNQVIKGIYSDSNTAIEWIKNKKAKTKIEVNEGNLQILQIISRAETWLLNNEVATPILKWETAIWGENPADFGRK
ncbi:ribonuclease H family protein [Chryseobacterium sp. KACC 21268]|nr:ribonuclease H family protein [Chryseobacterium sp. KACC 21268]